MSGRTRYSAFDPESDSACVRTPGRNRVRGRASSAFARALPRECSRARPRVRRSRVCTHARRRDPACMLDCAIPATCPASGDRVSNRLKRQFSPTKNTFSLISSLHRQVGSVFCQVGSLIRQSLRSQVSGSSLESRRSDRTASSLPFSSAKFKIAVSLSLRSWIATHGRYLPQCAAEVHYPHQRLFKVMTGGAATAGTGWRHVSHGIESQRVTNSGPK